MGQSASHKTDYESEALDSLLPSQYQDAEKLRAVIAAIIAPMQDLEDALWTAIEQRALALAEDEALDLLGHIVLQTRAERSDAQYRLWIETRIDANGSEGTPDEIMELVDDIAGEGVVYERLGVAYYLLSWSLSGGRPTDADTFGLQSLIAAATPSGVGYSATLSYAAPGPAFAFDTPGAGLGGGAFQTTRLDAYQG